MHKISYYFLLLLVCSVPWQKAIVIPGIGSVTSLLGFITIGIAALYILFKRHLKEPPMVIIIMILFILWAFISYLWSIQPIGTLSRFITNIQLLAMVWLIWELCDTRNHMLYIMQAFIIGAYVSIIDMMIMYFTSANVYRIAASDFNPNWLALTLAIGIPISWFLVFNISNNILKWINTLYIPLTLFCILLTASRGGTIAAIIGLSIIPATFIYLSKTNQILVLTGGIILSAFMILQYPKIYPTLERNIERIAGTTEAIQEGQLGGRQHIWKAGISVFRENPVLGIGARGYGAAMEEKMGRGFGSHNAYLSVLVETGIIGLILFLIMYIIAWIPTLYTSNFNRIFYFILLVTTMIAMVPARWEANKTPWLVLAIFMIGTTFMYRDGKFCLFKR